MMQQPSTADDRNNCLRCSISEQYPHTNGNGYSGGKDTITSTGFRIKAIPQIHHVEKFMDSRKRI